MNDQHTPAHNDPELSVVIVVGSERERAEDALASVLQQPEIERAEVILVDAADAGSRPLRGSDHLAVRLLAAAGRESYGALRAAGVRLARADVVAFLEDHSLAFPGWLRGLQAAFQQPIAAAGGVCYPSNPGTGWSDAVGALTYGRWRPPQPVGPCELLPGNNSAYQSELLMAFGDDLDNLLTCDTLLQWKVQQDAGRLYLADIAFAHRNETSARSALASVFHYHRWFGDLRSGLFDWSPLHRIGYLAFSWLVPWLRWGRLLRERRCASSHGPSLSLLDWIRLLLLQHAAAWGQVLGLLLGSGASQAGLVRCEIDEARPGFDIESLPAERRPALAGTQVSANSGNDHG